ncbi:MAG: dihydrofolate reductase [Methylocystis sp.]|nr:dihydrofolate reductase [Methylocystis sp.]MCA3585870.1 dihydrofolate reductase [Methylocystis sp.]MCA3586620.1 dihydrofolate reductase [Methylocystis sp.]MCA3591796.1 dihydrofolate reductase [Methylocystis sp.]
MTSLALIAAVARNGVIGRDNQLLWRIKADLQHFRRETLGRPVLMGRKTFESIGRPLPGRLTIVITRNASFQAEGVLSASSIEEGVKMAERSGSDAIDAERVMVAGGGEIYAQTIDQAARLFITEVDIEVEGDAFFPKIDQAKWLESRRESHPRGPDDDAAYSFVEYVRR